MLRNKIYEELKKAMKAQAKMRLEALRYLWSLIKNAEIDTKYELKDEEIIKIVGSEIKKRKEALRFAQGKPGEQMKDWIREEEEKLKMIEEFQPEQMGEGEISELVNRIISESDNRNFGEIMGKVMGQTKGKADGKVVAEIVRKVLSVNQQ